MSSGIRSKFRPRNACEHRRDCNLLEALRHTCPGVRVIYASSQVVYGAPLPEFVDDSVIPTPQSSYGAEKPICETPVNEYTRRGFIDGLSLRFPTISVRPGAPTAAVSSFLSGMIREPLSRLECVIPIEDRQFESCCVLLRRWRGTCYMRLRCLLRSCWLVFVKSMCLGFVSRCRR